MKEIVIVVVFLEYFTCFSVYGGLIYGFPNYIIRYILVNV